MSSSVGGQAPTEDQAAVRATARRDMARLGAPFLLGVLATSLQGVIDTAMIGRFSPTAFAAVAAATAVFDVLSSLALGSVAAHQILAARFGGRNDGRRIVQSLRNNARFTGVVLVPLFALCLFGGGWLTGLLTPGSSEALRQAGGQFLAYAAPTLIFSAAFMLITATFNGLKMAKQPMIAGLVVLGANVLLDWLLIYGPGFFPRMGAAGDGLATTLARLAGLLVLLWYARRVHLRRQLNSTSEEPVDFETSVPRLAWPAIISSGADYASTAVFFGLLGALGASELSGGRVAFHVMVLMFGLGSAFAAASRILIGRALGAHEPGRAGAVWRASRPALLIPALVFSTILILMPRHIALLFTDFPSVLTQASRVLPILGAIVPLIAWTLWNSSVVRAFGQTKLDMYGNLIPAICVQLPIAWLLGHQLDGGLPGAFVGVGTYWLVRGLLLEVWARRCLREASSTGQAERTTRKPKQATIGPTRPASGG